MRNFQTFSKSMDFTHYLKKKLDVLSLFMPRNYLEDIIAAKGDWEQVPEQIYQSKTAAGKLGETLVGSLSELVSFRLYTDRVMGLVNDMIVAEFSQESIDTYEDLQLG